MKKVVIVDYGMGNIKSVQRGLEKAGALVAISGKPEQFNDSDCLVLPGVGAFKDGMTGIQQNGLTEGLNEFVQSGKPVLGICLGMQMLMDFSEEYGVHKGLGYIPGGVKKIASKEKGKLIRKIPHIGWSELRYPAHNSGCRWDNSLLSQTREKEWFYFVHSFMAIPENNEHFLAECEYEGMRITAGIQKDNVTGVQFHPEKSGEAGLRILDRLVNG